MQIFLKKSINHYISVLSQEHVIQRIIFRFFGFIYLLRSLFLFLKYSVKMNVKQNSKYLL